MVPLTDFKKVNAFPCSLKELTLEWCRVASWDDMTVIASLPDLRGLSLRHDAVLGLEWNPIEEEFLKLKSLELVGLNLARWADDEAHFPALETLVLSHMDYLVAIPREFGELCSLKSISLRMCPDRINGNEEFVVRVLKKNFRIYDIGGAC